MSTLVLSTLVSFFASWSKAFQPFGFFVAICFLAPCASGKCSIGEVGDFVALPVVFSQGFTDGVTRLFSPLLVASDNAASDEKPLGFVDAVLVKNPPSIAVGKCSHLLNPHEARVLHASKLAVGKAFADGAAHCSLKPASVVALAGVESESLLDGFYRPSDGESTT